MKRGDPIYLFCPRCKGRVLVVEGVKPMCPGCASTDLVRPGSPMPDRIMPRHIFWSVMVLGVGVAIWFYVANSKDSKPIPPKTDTDVVKEAPVEPSKPLAELTLVEVNPQADKEKSDGQTTPSKVIAPVPSAPTAQTPGQSGPPVASREDEANPREVARLHRMVAVAATEMEVHRRTVAGKLDGAGISGNFRLDGIVANPAATEKSFRTVLQLAQEGQKAAEARADSLRGEIRAVSVGEPARRRGVEYFHAVTGLENEIWKELVNVLRDATAEVPAIALLMRKASARDSAGGLVFRGAADQAAWNERSAAFALLESRWRTVQEKLRAPASLPPAPAIPVPKTETDAP